jgi:hypothetical protein
MHLRLLLLLAVALAAPAAERPVRFAGTVSHAKEFRKEIAPGLSFVLNPTDTGWMIAIVPAAACADANEWAWVANPPYRNYNALFVDTGYGITAWEAAAWGPREFHFVTTCADYRRESQWVRTLLWPYSYSEKEVNEAQAKLGSSPLARGRFTIRGSKVSPAAEAIEGKNYGQIDWLRFDVEITFPDRAPQAADR